MTKIALSLALFLTATFGANAQVPGYSARNYEVFTLPTNSYPSAISNSREMLTSGFGTGYRIKNGVITPFTPPAPSIGLVFPNGLNESGDIVGEFRDAGNNGPFPFAQLRGVFEILTGPDGWTLFPSDINHRRVIVGSAERQGQPQVGFILENGQYTFVQCPDLNGQPQGAAFSSIARDGSIGGNCFGAKLRGFVYRGGAFTFHEFPGATYTRIFGINANGDLVGDARVEDLRGPKSVAFLYRNGVYHDISFPGLRQSAAVSINDLGDVLGSASALHVDTSGNIIDFAEFNYVIGTKDIK